jgi:TAG lipase/lysophosphatidylethanolamine acyltransferase
MLGLYDSVDLLAKDKAGNIVQWAPTEIKWRKWSDKVPTESESPLTRISELFNVNHFIVSQANPYIAPFIANEQFGSNMLIKCGHLLSSEIRHRINQLGHIGLLPFRDLIDEKVSGNITIVPYLTFSVSTILFFHNL